MCRLPKPGTGLMSLIIVAGAVAAAGPGASAETCTPGGLNQSVEGDPIGGIDWHILYTDDTWVDCGDAGDYFSQTWADKLRPIIMTADTRQVDDWGFESPWFNGLPDVDVVIFDSADTGTNNQTCVTLDAPRMRCYSDRSLRWVVSHEMFHGIQRRYETNGGLDGSLGFGAWFTEGTARCLDDRYDTELDGNGPFITDTNRLMNEDHEDLGPYRDLSLMSLSYRACLFWSYCCEQLGTNSAEPDSGIDFVRELWENVEDDLTANATKDALGSLKSTIVDTGGGSLNRLFHDFAICIYTREFDASTLPNPERYFFVDETPAGSAGASPYENMVRRAVYDGSLGFPFSDVDNVPSYGHKFYEVTIPAPSSSGVCEAVGLSGDAFNEIGWSLVGVKAPESVGDPERATILSKQVGKEYARAFLHNASSPLTRLGAIIVGLDDASQFDYEFDSGPVSVSIVRPIFTRPAYPGPANAPGRFLVRVLVDGPEGLKPPGVGDVSIKGLTQADFGVRVGTEEATILNSGYVGGEYWLVVEAPEQDADGLYDLTVLLCPDGGVPPTAVSEGAVLYTEFTINHMLVIDRSGSMQYPDDGSGSKLEAAKNAATLYIDAVNDNDRVGVVWFSGDESECNDDATASVGLGTATSSKRSSAKSSVNGLTPSGWTSIGDGLWKGQDEFDDFPLDDMDIKTIVLLSDGDENEARFWNSSIDCGGSDLGDSARSRLEPSDTTVNAIAFGPESNQELMQAIGSQTNGDYSYVHVADSADSGRGSADSMVSDLAETYMDHLQKARGLERIFFEADNAAGGATTTVEIPVGEGGVEDGTFFFNWPASAGPAAVELRDPSDTVITGAQATIYSTSTHVVYHMDSTLATGTWTAKLTPDNDTDYIAGLLGKQLAGVQLLADVAQVATGASFGTPNYGDFEQGVPVRILALLTESRGSVAGATVSAEVRRPDGTLSCARLILRDDGTQDDGEPGDGIYGAIFTDTFQAGSDEGVINDDPLEPNPGGTVGTYLVSVQASGTSITKESFTRSANAAFHVYEAIRNDQDEDGLRDTWEKYYGTSLTSDDALDDPDDDGSHNAQEQENGTDPFDQDTDDGGESDRSEIAHGRCPLDPTDDLLPCPEDVGVLDDTGDMDEGLLMPLANLLWFPVYPSYEKMRVFRAEEADPTNFVQVAELDLSGPQDGNYYDTGLTDGVTYLYRFQAVGAEGALSCMSRVVQGTAFAEPVPPLGWVDVNNGTEQIDSLAVLLTLNFTTGADKYRVSNTPFDGSEPLLDLPASPYVNWLIDLPLPGEAADVFLQYVNTAAGTSSEVYRASVIYDPNGDFDNDSILNFVDGDDDDDGLDDVDEVFIHHTEQYKADSDEDGLSDGEEVMDGCTNPRDPDSDGDGILDGADPSPASDLSGDHDTDLEDFALFQLCFTGDGGGPVLAVCQCVDTDQDGDVDLVDYEAFNAGLAGPN